MANVSGTDAAAMWGAFAVVAFMGEIAAADFSMTVFMVTLLRG
jgi:hypothetical protein